MQYRLETPPTAHMERPATSIALDSVAGETGAIALTLAPGFERPARFPDSILSFVTHTKVLGPTWDRFANLLATRTVSCNGRDVESALYGATA